MQITVISGVAERIRLHFLFENGPLVDFSNRKWRSGATFSGLSGGGFLYTEFQARRRCDFLYTEILGWRRCDFLYTASLISVNSIIDAFYTYKSRSGANFSGLSGPVFYLSCCLL